MAIRNFYLEGFVDGRESNLTGGPKSKDGGMEIFITQRKNGEIIKAVTINCFVMRDGSLKTVVINGNGDEVYSFITKRQEGKKNGQ